MRVTVEKAIELLLKGEIVGLPTETVYGLAASLKYPRATEQIFVRKGRPANNPLIVHLADESEIRKFVKKALPDFEKLAKAFWPGPLTMVLPITDLYAIPERLRAGLSTAAFRIPNQPLTLQILQKTGPLVMPSANLSGKPSPTHPEHVENDFGSDFPVLDGGACSFGLESTILYYDAKWKIIRQGSLSAEAFLPVLGYIPMIEIGEKKETPLCPGQLYRHYAPKAKLWLCHHIPSNASIVIGFDDRKYPNVSRLLSLGSLSKPSEIAANLYKVLRQLDTENINEAWVDNHFPDDGIFATLRERLQKASRS